MTGAFAELYSWCPIVTTAPLLRLSRKENKAEIKKLKLKKLIPLVGLAGSLVNLVLAKIIPPGETNSHYSRAVAMTVLYPSYSKSQLWW